MCCWNADMMDPWDTGGCTVRVAVSCMRRVLEGVYHTPIIRRKLADCSIDAFVDLVQPCLVIKTSSRAMPQGPLRIACVITFDRKPCCIRPLDVWHIWESQVLDVHSVMLHCTLRDHEAAIWACDGDAMHKCVTDAGPSVMTAAMKSFLHVLLQCLSTGSQKAPTEIALRDHMLVWFRQVNRERENALLCGAFHARSSSVLKVFPDDVIKTLILGERQRWNHCLQRASTNVGMRVNNYTHIRFASRISP